MSKRVPSPRRGGGNGFTLPAIWGGAGSLSEHASLSTMRTSMIATVTLATALACIGNEVMHVRVGATCPCSYDACALCEIGG